jgi:thioredoxin reductase
MQGKDVTVIEMEEKLAKNATYLQRRALMLELETKVKTHTNTICREITHDGVIAEDADGNRKLFEADSFIVAVGYEASTELVDSLRECDCKYITIGDCLGRPLSKRPFTLAALPP